MADLRASPGEVERAYHGARLSFSNCALALVEFETRVAQLEISGEHLEARAGDLFLAWAAGSGDAEALHLIEERIVLRLAGRLRRIGLRDDKVPDVLQTVRERLYSGPTPRILAYNASATLERWIRVIAVRVAIDFHRKEENLQPAEITLFDRVISKGPEITDLLVKGRYMVAFRDALRAEIARLPTRDRTVLRLHVVQGISVENIATMYRVHRVTVARWIWHAGEVLLRELRRHFVDQFGMVPRDFDSVVRLLRSQVSLGLSELLKVETDQVPDDQAPAAASTMRR